MTLPNKNVNLGNLFEGDKVLWMVLFFLCIISILEVYSASSNMTFEKGAYWSPVLKHGMYLCLGVGITWVIHRIHCRYFGWIVIIGPIFNYNIMAKFTSQLDEREIPYALLDSNWPEFNHRIFYGQDSLQSGAFSGHIMSLATDASTKKMALFKVLGEGRVASRQQMNREVGFRQYMEEHKPDIEIVDVNLYVYDKQGMREIMRDFFTENPDIRYALCFNSSIHIIADFLRTEMPDHPHVTLLGYDAVDANVECIKNGSADFLIAQHPQSQGLDCFRSMFNTCVLKMNIKRDHYMAIELLTKENIDFYKD